ncbi:hypothetical protein Bphy_3753 [Paraburkholderia phymatum STM815]|uniref:Uncharacterized protein n=1 Tax=Paraburkholderia phymatum (strain DSM 17167 / CIP 108236 / LMG 21445 / STM815) TaxID=391038 RepID=B2JN36_PARP8|nr:hypothetical protein Bphy_3753 [Paraburkholderia phymatum STM815]
MRLDYFRYCGNPKITARSPSSTHTYRLLVFKEHSLKSCCLLLLSCVSVVWRGRIMRNPKGVVKRKLKIIFWGHLRIGSPVALIGVSSERTQATSRRIAYRKNNSIKSIHASTRHTLTLAA